MGSNTEYYKCPLIILSFSPTPSSNKHPYFIQVSQDETSQFKAIAAMAESFKWKNVILICEDAANEIEVAKFMSNTLQEKNIFVTYISLISTSSSNELVYEELHKLSDMQTDVYIMHACHSLYDAVSALAMAIERTQTVGQVLKSNIKNWETSSKIRRDTSLMDQMLRISFRGLAGTFQLMNGRMSTQVLEIINVIGKREQRVGFWTKGIGLTGKIDKMFKMLDIFISRKAGWSGGGKRT
nr:extracellular ligand-binding receptor [Tanacetum cinerariifolium]